MKKITIGMIGAGRIGKLHAENLRRLPNVRLKTVSDIRVEHLMPWANDLGIEALTDDYRQLFRDPDIHAVLICSSTDTHANMIAEAAEAGKHIFCEKPVSFHLKETIRAIEAVQKAGVTLQIGFNRRFDHNFKKVREALKSGKIGLPHLIKVTSRDPEPPPREYIRVSGGMFIDMSIHDFDMVRYLSGSEVEKVYVAGTVRIDPAFTEFGDVDTAVITLTFKDGTLGMIDNSRKAVYGYDQRVEVFGSLGCVTAFNDFPDSTEIVTAEGTLSEKPKHFFLERYKEAYCAEMAEFIDAIAQGKPAAVDGNDGFQAELIAHAARRSLLENRPVNISEIWGEVNR